MKGLAALQVTGALFEMLVREQKAVGKTTYYTMPYVKYGKV
jgi:hypothetical protein